MNIIKSDKFDSSKIVMSRKISRKGHDDAVHIFYKTEKGSEPFWLSIGPLDAPHGLDTYGVARCTITEEHKEIIQTLDKLALSIGAARSVDLFGKELKKSEIPYKRLLQPDTEGEETPATTQSPLEDDYIDLPINKKTIVFDKTKQKLDDPFQKLSRRYAGNYLLCMNYLIVRNGQLKWGLSVPQVMLLKMESLPSGCLIITDEDELLQKLQERSLQDEDTATDIDEISEDGYDINKNELLD